jgi:hypothetical protein
MPAPLYAMKNPGELPVPRAIAILMVCVFSLPWVVIPMTVSALGDSPWLLGVWVGACFPLAMLYALERLMGRYAVIVNDDGSLRVMLPFKTLEVAPGEPQRVAFNTARMHVGGTVQTRTWVQLIGAADRLLTQFATSAFSGEQVQGLLDALRRVNPALPIQQD